jgi:hypothetical protein
MEKERMTRILETSVKPEIHVPDKPKSTKNQEQDQKEETKDVKGKI